MEKNKIAFLTGAGISQPSGLSTFRTHNGLWNQQKIEDVAMYKGFLKDPVNVHQFYNNLRSEINNCKPNIAHLLIAELEKDYDVTVITQNIDNLHEVAGSTNVIHLHGQHNLQKCEACHDLFTWNRDWIYNKDTCPTCREAHLVRPGIIWFDESLDAEKIYKAEDAIIAADLFVQVGTSAEVSPANKLIKRAKRRKRVEMNLVRSNPRNPWLFHNYYMGNVIRTMPEFIKDIPELMLLKEKGITKIIN